MGKLKIDISYENLFELYVSKRLPVSQILNQLNCSRRTLQRRLREYGLSDHPDRLKRSQLLRNREWLFDQYITKENSTTQIGETLSVSNGTVRRWLVNHKIPTRPPGGSDRHGKKMPIESRQKMSAAKKGKYLGEANPNWKGGEINPLQRARRAPEARHWSKAVKQRDGYACQMCGASKKLHSHHIIPFSKSVSLRWDINNGITLCSHCHEKVHKFKFPNWVHGADQNEKPSNPVVLPKKKRFAPPFSKLAHLYEEHSIRDIADHFDVSPETVRKKVHEYGISIRKTGPRKTFEVDRDTLKRLYQNKTLEQIANLFGVGQTVVFNRIREFGITFDTFPDSNPKKRPHTKVRSQKHRENLKKALKGKLMGENNPNYKGSTYKKNCYVCGAEFFFHKSRLASAKFCSNICRGKARSAKT